MDSLANPNGAFIDNNTAVKFSMAQIKITMCLYQETMHNNKHSLKQRFAQTQEVVERLGSALQQINIQIKPCDAQGYIDNLARLWHNHKVDYKPNVLELIDSGLSQQAIGKHTQIYCNKGVFKFIHKQQTKYCAYLPVESISKELVLGHITAERDDKTSLFDKLPAGSTYVQTTVHMHGDLANQQLEQISKSVLGTDITALTNKQAVRLCVRLPCAMIYIVLLQASI